MVGGNGEGAALSDGIFGGGRFFLGIPFLWGRQGGGIMVGLFLWEFGGAFDVWLLYCQNQG